MLRMKPGRGKSDLWVLKRAESANSVVEGRRSWESPLPPSKRKALSDERIGVALWIAGWLNGSETALSMAQAGS
jgi:hypothetical protein